MSKEIRSWMDIKPTAKELARLQNIGTKYNHRWQLDKKDIGNSKLHALKVLKRKLFAEYKDGLRK